MPKIYNSNFLCYNKYWQEENVMELNRNKLAETFDMDDIEKEAECIEVCAEDPIEVIKDNIDRANRILNRVEEEIQNGNFTARMVEVAGNLINGVTAAGKEWISDTNYKRYLQIREAMLQYKYDELEMKKTKYSAPSSQNIIFSDRESVLKFLNGEQKKIE
jgi:uncharacterized protein YkuJ